MCLMPVSLLVALACILQAAPEGCLRNNLRIHHQLMEFCISEHVSFCVFTSIAFYLGGKNWVQAIVSEKS
jgi:hypothetical protein